MRAAIGKDCGDAAFERLDAGSCAWPANMLHGRGALGGRGGRGRCAIGLSRNSSPRIW
jgi:hypothetical protein